MFEGFACGTPAAAVPYIIISINPNQTKFTVFYVTLPKQLDNCHVCTSANAVLRALPLSRVSARGGGI
ncbi:MAG: hypothetical protein LBU65_01195 [Planctomycetaceae bacterium]|nr:hypothetical protein [Planctomycetaceae bacterium]